MTDKEQSVWDKTKGVVGKVIDSPLGEFGRRLLLSKDDNALIEQVEKEVAKAKGTPIYTILKETGMISEDKASLAIRWGTSRGDTNDGREGAKKLLQAFEDYKAGRLTILTYSKDAGYKNENLQTYENKIRSDVNFMNVNLMKGFFGLRGTKMGFQDATWNQIGLYVLNRGGKSNLVTGWESKDIENIMSLGKKEKENKETTIQKSLQEVWNNKKMKDFLENKGILINNRLDISNELGTLRKGNKSIAEVERHFEGLAGKLLEEARLLMKESKVIAKETKLDKKSLRDVGIVDIISTDKNGKSINISDFPISSLDSQGSKDAIIGIDKWFAQQDKKSPDYESKKELVANIKRILTPRIAAIQRVENAAVAQNTAKKAKKDAEQGITTQTFKPLDTKTEEVIKSIAGARFVQETTQGSLKDYNIYTLSHAENKLNELKNKGTLTEEEQYLKKLLEAFIRDNIAVAREEQIAEKIIGQTQARELFIETNRFISGDLKENYNFDNLEQIAVRNDPEATSGEKRFAGLKVGESISIEAFVERRQGDEPAYSIPEFTESHIIKNADGTYSIKGLLNIDKHLTRKELREYIKTTRIYADIGLGQFIPHIPLISNELRKQGINTKVDGIFDTKEQQDILKAIYKMLFGEDLLSSNLTEVKASFQSKLGGTDNMRGRMQGILRGHKLIGDDRNRRIDPNTLQSWMKKCREDNQTPLLLI